MTSFFRSRGAALQAAATLLACAAASVAQAETGIAALLQSSARVQAGSNSDSQSDASQWTSMPYASLRSSVYASAQDGAQDPDGVTAATTSGYASADWTDTTFGTGVVVLHDGWSILPKDQAASGSLGELSPTFLYSFIADAGDVLTVQYAHTGSTQIGWDIQLDGGPEGTRSLASAGGTGSFVATLTAGASYNFMLIPSEGTLAGIDATDATFNWQIAAAPVPEPMPALLLAAGLSVLGLRRLRDHLPR